MEPMSIEEVLAADARLASDDVAVALRLARSATGSEAEAWQLMHEAQEYAERIAATLAFQSAVQAVAGALLRDRQLDRPTVTALIDEEIPDGKDDDR